MTHNMYLIFKKNCLLKKSTTSVEGYKNQVDTNYGITSKKVATRPSLIQ